MAKKPLTPGRIQKLASNPGTRAALADKYLTSGQLKERQRIAYGRTPITQGSPLTNADLARQTKNATTVQYGAQEQAQNARLAASQQTEKDQGGWYDAYLAELRQHQGNTAGINTQADTAFKNLTGAVGKLGTGVEGTNAQGDAQNAQAVRQGLLASFAGLQGETGRNANTYADTLSHVVGPGQKLTAQAQGRRNTNAVRSDLADTGRQKGSYAAKFMADTLANEQKNVLATTALTNKDAATQAADNYRNAQIDLKRGVDPVTGKPLPKDKKPPTGYGPNAPGMNKYGYTYAEWTKLPPGTQAKARAGNGTKAKPQNAVSQAADDFFNKYGMKPATQVAVSKAQGSIDSAKTWIGTVKQSNPGMSNRELLTLLTTGQAGDKASGTTKIPAHNALWVQVALDLAGPTHRISDGTANRLHHAGYSVKALGLPSMAGRGAGVQIHRRPPSSGPSSGDPTGRFR